MCCGETGTHVLRFAMKIVRVLLESILKTILTMVAFFIRFDPRISTILCRITYTILVGKKGSHLNVQQLNELWYVIE